MYGGVSLELFEKLEAVLSSKFVMRFVAAKIDYSGSGPVTVTLPDNFISRFGV